MLRTQRWRLPSPLRSAAPGRGAMRRAPQSSAAWARFWLASTLLASGASFWYLRLKCWYSSEYSICAACVNIERGEQCVALAAVVAHLAHHAPCETRPCRLPHRQLVSHRRNRSSTPRVVPHELSRQPGKELLCRRSAVVRLAGCLYRAVLRDHLQEDGMSQCPPPQPPPSPVHARRPLLLLGWLALACDLAPVLFAWHLTGKAMLGSSLQDSASRRPR